MNKTTAEVTLDEDIVITSFIQELWFRVLSKVSKAKDGEIVETKRGDIVKISVSKFEIVLNCLNNSESVLFELDNYHSPKRMTKNQECILHFVDCFKKDSFEAEAKIRYIGRIMQKIEEITDNFNERNILPEKMYIKQKNLASEIAPDFTKCIFNRDTDMFFVNTKTHQLMSISGNKYGVAAKKLDRLDIKDLAYIESLFSA